MASRRWRVLAAAVLLIVHADTQRLLPVFAIGVFIGFTISQTGLVCALARERGPRWVGNAVLNGTGAVLTAVAGIVLLASKFTEGAWLLVILVPSLILLFDRIERYYQRAAEQLGLGQIPAQAGAAVSTRTLWSLSRSSRSARWPSARCRPRCGLAAKWCRSLSRSTRTRLSGCCKQWQEWDPGVELKVLPSPHRSLVAPTVSFVRTQIEQGRDVTVLLANVEPRRWRHRLLYNQRGPILEAALRARTDAIIATLAIRID